jgi:hypothetical protein
METQLQTENASLRFENAKLKFETLFRERPSTIRSFAFHGGLRIFYLIIGSIGLVGSLIYFGLMLAALSVNDRIADYLEEKQNVERVLAEYAADTVVPLQMTLSIVLLILSICLLIMARLCRKIVRRNMYIMDLENIWMDLKEQ